MARKAGRSAADTKGLLLAAATAEIGLHGLGVTLDEIAATAGISKGGLVYHFASKEILVAELAREQVRLFRAAIAAKADPGDEAPGRLTRAYIRAMLDPQHDTAAAWESSGVLWQIMTDLAVQQIVREAYEQLATELAGDGLPAELSTLVIAAADGGTAPVLWGAPIDAARNLVLEEMLIGMTRGASIAAATSHEEPDV